MTEQSKAVTSVGKEVSGPNQTLKRWVRKWRRASVNHQRRNNQKSALVSERNTKLVRQEEMRTQAVLSMVELAKSKSDALEERNEIFSFSSNDAVGLPEKTQSFEELCQNYLVSALKRAWIVLQDGKSISLSNGHGISDTGRTVEPTELAEDEP